jgi:uncharacterized glyoxalase superfamily protein PhnB
MNPIPPEGWPAVLPRLFVDDPESLVEFIKGTFNATGIYQTDRPSELRIEDSVILVSSASAAGAFIRAKATAFLYVYVEKVDETFERALQRGATAIEKPQLMHYGDRRGMVEDPWGNVWQIATKPGLL